MGLSEEIVERCRKIPASTWSDALDRLGVPGVLHGIERRTGSGTVAGPALTVAEEVHDLGAVEPDDFEIGLALREARPGDVMVIAMGGSRVSSLGGLAAKRVLNRGVEAVVIDGGCRDLDEIVETGLAVSSRFLTPLSGKRRIRITGVNDDVEVAGVTVSPGDLVVADDTGAVAIPAERLEEALEIAEQVAAKDVAQSEAIDRGEL